MAMVSKLVTCERATTRAPHTLKKVKRDWRRPPPVLGLYVEFYRQDESEVFDWSLRVLRGSRVIHESESTVELPDRNFIEYVFNLELGLAEPKTYRVEFVIGGVAAASTMVDFGKQEARE